MLSIFFSTQTRLAYNTYFTICPLLLVFKITSTRPSKLSPRPFCNGISLLQAYVLGNLYSSRYHFSGFYLPSSEGSTLVWQRALNLKFWFSPSTGGVTSADITKSTMKTPKGDYKLSIQGGFTGPSLRTTDTKGSICYWL